MADNETIPDIEGQTEISTDDAEMATNVMDNAEAQQIVQYESFMLEMGWDNGEEHRKEIFEKISALKDALKQNLEELSDNAKAMAENEQSFANRALTAATVAATGIGGMELMRGLAEQSADSDAAAAMADYITTMQCEYANGKIVKAGRDEIELPGGNDEKMMAYRNEYFGLASDLKARKDALGMKPGIESEEILDNRNLGLYDDENTGITSGSEASLYRAQMLDSEKDKSKLDDAAAASKRRVVGGAVAAAAGAVIGIVGNHMINKDVKNRADEILAKRADIKQQLDEVFQFEIDDCNAKIQQTKEWANEQKHTDEYKQNSGLRDWVSEIEQMEFIDNLEKLKDHPICD